MATKETQVELDNNHIFDVLKSLYPNANTDGLVMNNGDYVDVEFWQKTIDMEDDSENTDVTARFRITVDIDASSVYTVSTLNSEEKGDDCDVVVTQKIIDEIQEIVDSEILKIKKLFNDNNIIVDMDNTKVQWYDSPNLENDSTMK